MLLVAGHVTHIPHNFTSIVTQAYFDTTIFMTLCYDKNNWDEFWNIRTWVAIS